MSIWTTWGPAALNSSRPTLATPNQGLSWAASRWASTASSTSRASASFGRSSAGTGGTSVLGSTFMVSSCQLVDGTDPVSLAPPQQLVENPDRGARVGEGGGAHLHGVGAGSDQLGGVLTRRDSADTHDGKVRLLPRRGGARPSPGRERGPSTC